MIATFQAFFEGRRYFWLASIVPHRTESQKEGSVLIIGLRGEGVGSDGFGETRISGGFCFHVGFGVCGVWGLGVRV